MIISKWKINIDGLDLFVFGSDNELYRLPHVKNNRSYCLRKIKMQYPSRWIIYGEAYSKNRLRGNLIRDERKIILVDNSENIPF